jgi:hypothetical protein
MVSVIRAPQRIVRRDMDSMRARKDIFAPGPQKPAGAVKDDHWVLTAVENVDVVLAVDANGRHLAIAPAIRQFPQLSLTSYRYSPSPIVIVMTRLLPAVQARLREHAVIRQAAGGTAQRHEALVRGMFRELFCDRYGWR